MSWIENTGLKNIYEREKQNRQKLIDILSNYDFINIIGNNSNLKYTGIISFIIPDFRKNPYFLVVYIGIIFFESSFPSWHCV